MKRILMWLLPCLTWVGCSAGGVDESGTTDYAEADVVADSTANLSNCTLLGHTDTPYGSIDTMNCNGVGCMISCAPSVGDGELRCSTRCENGPQPPSSPYLDLSILRPECRIQPGGRINAGWRGISKATCENVQGACFDNRTRDPKFPWCYEPMGKQPTCGGIAPSARINAGFPGITGENCIRYRGACYDESVPGVPWCFQHPN